MKTPTFDHPVRLYHTSPPCYSLTASLPTLDPNSYRILVSLFPSCCSYDHSRSTSPVTFDPSSGTQSHRPIIWDFALLKIKQISPTLWVIIFLIYLSNKVLFVHSLPSEYAVAGI